jgi:hypothetical protein
LLLGHQNSPLKVIILFWQSAFKFGKFVVRSADLPPVLPDLFWKKNQNVLQITQYRA